MTSLPEIIHCPLPHSHSDKPFLRLCVDRLTLSKRRWRGLAEDGRDFGFDLERPLRNRELFFETDTHCYQIVQTAEPVLEVPLAEAKSAAAMALLGWNIGNLHFPMEIAEGCLRVAEDPALRRLFEREGIAFVEEVSVFTSLTSSSPHGPH